MEFVNIIQKRNHGVNTLLTILYLILLYSCTTGYRFVLSDDGLKYKEESIDLCGELFGDMSRIETGNNEFLVLSNILESKKHLVSLKTLSSPFYEAHYFVNLNRSDVELIDNYKRQGTLIWDKTFVNNSTIYIILFFDPVKIFNMNGLENDLNGLIDKIYNCNEIKDDDILNTFNTVKDSPDLLYQYRSIDKFPNSFLKSQLLATIDSQFAVDSLTKIFKTKPLKHQKCLPEPRQKTVVESNVFKLISSEISNERLVIINENHWMPKHRLLMDSLLPVFVKNKFTHIGLEALDPNLDDFQINFNSGFILENRNLVNYFEI